MPSIAITKADVGHTEFGEISLVFDKESINPTDRRNKVYGEDAWTPTFPTVGYKLNDEKTSDIYRRANKTGSLPLFNPVIFHPDNYESYISSVGSEGLVNHFKDDYGAKQLYLSETGSAVEKYEQHEVDKYLPDQIALYEKMLKEIGIERIKNERSDALENEVKRLIKEHYNIDLDGMKPFRAKARISNTIHHAVDYAEHGNRKTETDIEATKKKIDERIDPEKFEAWLENLFSGVVEKKGIRNDKDMFTPSGSSRKWEQLYDDITLDSVVNAMQRQAARGGQGLFNGSIFGAAQEEYKSIDEIRKEARERIRTMNDAEYKAQRDSITDRLSDIKISGVGNGFSDTMDMAGNIQDAVARSHTAKGIHKYLKGFYPKVTMETANEIADIVKDIQRMSARYFEAKPYRAVGFDEVRLAVVPSDMDKELVQKLEQRGIPVRTYEKGNEAQRRQIVEEATDEMNLRFRFIGEQGAARLDKAEEATTRLDNLSVARQMEEEGKNAWTIKSATGWERGADRKWRYETPDFEYTPPEDFEKGKNYNLSDIIKDDELFKAYPKLKGLKFRLEHQPDEYGGGWFDKLGNAIVINTAHNSPWHYEQTIAHEIQHAIQAEEGFEKGDSPEGVIDRYVASQSDLLTADAATLNTAAFIRKRAEKLIRKGEYKYMRWAVRAAMGRLQGRNGMYEEYGPIENLAVSYTAKDLKFAYERAYEKAHSNGTLLNSGYPTKQAAEFIYIHNAGETEARNVARRLELSLEQRRNMLASETEDVARRDQLFINSALGESASYAPSVEDISLVNERFNEELADFSIKNADKIYFDLGMPSAELLAAGVENRPIRLHGSKVAKKMKKHGFESYELRNLPMAVAHPIAVFDNLGRDGNRSILTELKTSNGNFLVTIDLGKGTEADFDIVSSVFGKRGESVVEWINKGYMRFVDKEKALDYLHLSAPIAEALDSSKLSDATKIVENFENPIIDSEITRNGSVNLSDDALSSANDPVAKMLGKSTRTARQRKEFAERERRNTAKRVQELGEKLHLDNVEIVTEPMTITDRQGKTHHPKGFYNPRTGKITVVVPNNVNTFDAEQTLLHEAVAHYGLRRLFGEHFDTFLDNVFNNADVDVRRKIVELAKKNGWNQRLATEEYLASLAENTNFEDLNASWWRKIKELFLRMLHKIGFNDFNGVTLSDNELRYILWRSYENLAEPGRYRSILGEAADVVKQHELKVGNYAQVPAETDHAAEEANDLYRETPDGEASDDGSREAYNRAVAGNRFKAQEAYQDSMLALKRLQEVVEKFSGNKLKSYENAYMAENQMSSKSTREAEVYGQKFFKPMLQEVATLMKQGAGYPEIIDYMIAKHGLERNEVFAERDALQEAERRFEKSYKELEQLYKLGNITQDDYEKRKNKIDTEKEEYYQKRLAQHLEEDYSGLTALAEKYDEADKGFKANAKDMVNDFEGRFDTRALWERVNAATKETLRKSYESGMMSRDTYDKVSKMFNHYIPLRGWDVDTAEDVYEYITSKKNIFNPTIKRAGGRKSMADDPFANIGNMAESAILQGNRNLMKQNFLNMAINHPTDVLTVREAWYAKDTDTGEWVLSFPDIEEDDDADTIARKVEEHEERMNMLKEKGEATQVKERLNIDYRISARKAKEHIVNVKRNGKDYLVFVNGNPRAAQAVNGQTNPNVEDGWMAGVSRFNRWMAANFTTRNPAFVMSNLSRDLIFSISAVRVKEGSEYARQFSKNILPSMRAISRGLKGKQPQTEADRYFQEFLDNGGETGFTSLHNVDEYKRIVRKELKKLRNETDYLAAMKWVAGKFSTMNRWAEDVARFNAYMTSRQQGKTITESINDAKEVTVNFNRKGAGFKTGGFFGKTSGVFRGLYLFFNAAVQSLANFIKLGKKNPKAFLTLLGGFTAAGFLVPMLNALLIGDGDDDYYGNLPDWVRRNNLCIYVGDGKFFTLPLPIELRAFYGLGEMAYQAMVGKDEYASENVAYAAINQITELLPFNPLGSNGDIVTTFVPDFFIPFWEAGTNEDFTGKPVFKDTPFNESMPEWTKAYKGTSAVLVDASEKLNEWTGGDKYKKGWIDKVQLKGLNLNNPAQIEHIFEGYFGGMAKTFNQTAKTLAGGVESVLQGEKSDDLQWYSTPVLNRFFNDASDDRSAFSKVNERYYRLYDLYEEVGKELRGYGREAARGDLDYLDKLNKLYQSDDYKKYSIFKRNKRIIDRIRDMEKKLPEEATKEKEELQKKVAAMKRSLLEQIDNLE